MFKSGQNYPARVRRNLSLIKAKESFEQFVEGGEEPSGGGEAAVWVAGRIIGILDDGFVLQDDSGRLEIVGAGGGAGSESVGLGQAGIGDIVEVRIEKEERPVRGGKMETVFVSMEVVVLTPCGKDFFIGKESPNYLKAVIDVNLREKLRMRSLLTAKIREFFAREGFMEVETPEMVRLPGMEPHLDVFKTSFRSWQADGPSIKNEKLEIRNGPSAEGGLPGQTLDFAPKQNSCDMYLITSPEYALKKLLVAGYEDIFQICKSFRNKEHISNLHNPEFTILEWYRAYASYLEIMADTEKLVCSLAKFVRENFSVGDDDLGTEEIVFNKQKVNLAGPWPRIKVKDLFRDMAGISYEEFEDPEKLRAAVQKKGYKVDSKTPYEDLFFEVFLNEIEPKLGMEKPVIVYEYPAQMAALSKRCQDDPRYAERFEVYIAGMELCNAFTELNDPEEQFYRLAAERKERQKMGKDDYPVDQSFIEALQFGMPPAGGIALGVDRLMMLLTDTADINDIIFFPHRDL